MAVAWAGLAVGAEVSVITDRALITDSADVFLLVLAERAIAVDVLVTVVNPARLWDRLIDWNEAVMRVNELDALVAFSTVIPVWAVQALVANTEYRLIAPITQSRVADITPWSAQELGHWTHWSALVDGLEGMAWVVAMLAAFVARNAQVVVIAIKTSYELVLRKDVDAAVASTSWLLENILLRLVLLLVGERTRHLLRNNFVWLWNIFLWLWNDDLRGAVHNLTILDCSLDKPVISIGAMHATIHASLAKIVISIVANVAMIVLAVHGFVADIAVYRPCHCRWRSNSLDLRLRLWPESELPLASDVGKLIAEGIAAQASR